MIEAFDGIPINQRLLIHGRRSVPTFTYDALSSITSLPPLSRLARRRPSPAHGGPSRLSRTTQDSVPRVRRNKIIPPLAPRVARTPAVLGFVPLCAVAVRVRVLYLCLTLYMQYMVYM